MIGNLGFFLVFNLKCRVAIEITLFVNNAALLLGMVLII